MANRFMQPVATPMDVQWYKPNFELWAKVLEKQQQQYDVANEFASQNPDYNRRIDQDAFNQWRSDRDKRIDSVANTYATRGVLAGNRDLAQLVMDTKADFSPGGGAAEFIMRNAAINAGADQIREMYKDTPHVIDYALNKFYNEGIEPYKKKDGSYGSVIGINTPSPFTAEEKINIENKILSEIKDTLLNSSPTVRKLVQNGEFDSLVQVVSSLSGVDQRRAMAIIENRMPREMIDFANFERESRGQFVKPGTDIYSFTTRDANGKVTGYNQANPLLGDFLGMVQSATRTTQDSQIRSLTDHAGLAAFEFNMNNAGMFNPMPDGSQNTQTTGIFGEGTTSANMGAKVAGARMGWEKTALEFANRNNGVKERTPEEALRILNNALALPDDIWEQRFPHETRSALLGKQKYYNDATNLAGQLDQIGNEAIVQRYGEKGLRAVQEYEQNLRKKIIELQATNPELQKYDVEQLAAMSENFGVSASAVPGSGMVRDLPSYNVPGIGENVDDPALASVIDLKDKMISSIQPYLDHKSNTIDTRLSENVSQQYNVYPDLPLRGQDGQIDVQASKAFNDYADEVFSSPQRIMSYQIKDKDLGMVNSGELVRDLMESLLEREATDREIATLTYRGITSAPDADGHYKASISFIDEDNEGKSFYIDLPSHMEELAKYKIPTSQLNNIISYDPDPENRLAAVDAYVVGDSDHIMGTVMAGGNRQPSGTSFRETDPFGNPLVEVRVDGGIKGGIPLTDATGNQTGRHITITPLQPNGQPYLNDNNQPIIFTSEEKAKTFIKARTQQGYLNYFGIDATAEN